MATTAVVRQKISDFNTYFTKRSESAAFQSIIARHMQPDRVAKMAVAAMMRNPTLMQCKPETVWLCVANAASLGLEVNLLGAAYLVPFKNNKTGGTDCQLIVGYQGLIDLIRRSGHIQQIEAHVIYEKDTFDVVYGTESKVEHKPLLTGDRGDMVAVYGVATFKDGCKQVEVMTKSDIDKIRAMSKAGKFGPWADHYDEMARKTVVRRLCKYLPKSVEMTQAMVSEDEGAAAGLAVSGMAIDDEVMEAAIVDEEDQDITDDIKKDAKSRNKKSKPADISELIEWISEAVENVGTDIIIKYSQENSINDWRTCGEDQLKQIKALYQNA